ncbi:TraR/DksA C4-type zinc finger protein [Candidatus Daviesbacteria bacterium]|nr:TraR/DksA C4-type zinc finger protein [Candidatus Daviesbacteria bacterium]
MLDFPTKTINYIKNNLLRQQKEVEKNLKEVGDDDPATTQVLAESSEPGTDSYIADSHTKTIVLEEQLKKTNNSIKAALQRIKQGTYGTCESCGHKIEVGRLLIMPTASLCISCSKKTSK